MQQFMQLHPLFFLKLIFRQKLSSEIEKRKRKMKRVVLGMSGGVDSSVAAHILKQKRYDVLGVFMKNWDEKSEHGVCMARQDFLDVEAVCKKLDIPYFDVNFEEEYNHRVFNYFLNELQKGRTPNPDVMCNNEIKFKAFLEFAMDIKADYMATGHFARIERSREGSILKKGIDANKDQSYFLSGLSSQQLDKALFPLGNMTKNDVRKIASELKLPNAKKKDSTGICFIGERNFNRFLSGYLPNQPGEIIDIDSGKVMGLHNGLMYYTIGQRKGLGIGGNEHNQPWYVVDKDVKTRVLKVVQGKNHPARFDHALITENSHWIKSAPDMPLNCMAKFRYRQADKPVRLIPMENQRLLVIFDQAQTGITPGQMAVFYQEDICLGNATIHQAVRSKKELKQIKDAYL